MGCAESTTFSDVSIHLAVLDYVTGEASMRLNYREKVESLGFFMGQWRLASGLSDSPNGLAEVL